MYLSGGNATANASLLLARNYVVWLAHLGSPKYTERNPAERAEIKPYYVIKRETLARKSIYNYLTRIIAVDNIINAKALKAPWKSNNYR